MFFFTLAPRPAAWSSGAPSAQRMGRNEESPVRPSLNKKGERGMIGTDNGALSVDDLTCFVAVLVDERLVVLGHATERHTHA